MGSLYGFEVESELPLRRLNPAAGTRGDAAVEAAAEPPLERRQQEPAGTLRRRGRPPLVRLLRAGGRPLPARAAADRRLPARARPRAGSWSTTRTATPSCSSTGSPPRRSAPCWRCAATSSCTPRRSRPTGARSLFCGPTQRGKSTLARALGEAGLPRARRGRDRDRAGRGTGRPPIPGARGVRVAQPRRAAGASAPTWSPDPGRGRAGALPGRGGRPARRARRGA